MPYSLHRHKTEDETRYLVLGKIDGRHWSGVLTYRSEVIRLIPFAVPEKRRSPSMKAKDFDRAFDEGEDITSRLDLAGARRPEQEQKRVNVDFPLWMIHQLDREARRLGVPRQSIIKIWIAERLKQAS